MAENSIKYWFYISRKPVKFLLIHSDFSNFYKCSLFETFWKIKLSKWAEILLVFMTSKSSLVKISAIQLARNIKTTIKTCQDYITRSLWSNPTTYMQLNANLIFIQYFFFYFYIGQWRMPKLLVSTFRFKKPKWRWEFKFLLPTPRNWKKFVTGNQTSLRNALKRS